MRINEQLLAVWPSNPWGHEGFYIRVTYRGDDSVVGGPYSWEAWSFSEGSEHLCRSSIGFKNVSDAVEDAMPVIMAWGPVKPTRPHIDKLKDELEMHEGNAALLRHMISNFHRLEGSGDAPIR